MAESLRRKPTPLADLIPLLNEAADALDLAAAPAPQPTGDELRAMLVKARAGLANGLWDYGPGQDEHEQCDALIAEIDAMLAASPSPQHDGPSDAEMLDWMEANCGVWTGDGIWYGTDWANRKLVEASTLREAIRVAMRGDTGGKTNG